MNICASWLIDDRFFGTNKMVIANQNKRSLKCISTFTILIDIMSFKNYWCSLLKRVPQPFSSKSIDTVGKGRTHDWCKPSNIE